MSSELIMSIIFNKITKIIMVKNTFSDLTKIFFNVFFLLFSNVFSYFILIYHLMEPFDGFFEIVHN